MPGPRDLPLTGAQDGRATSAVILLIVAAISTFTGFFVAVPALVIAVVSVLFQRSSPSRSATLARWGWIAYVVGAGLMLAYGVALVVAASLAVSGSS